MERYSVASRPAMEAFMWSPIKNADVVQLSVSKNHFLRLSDMRSCLLTEFILWLLAELEIEMIWNHIISLFSNPSSFRTEQFLDSVRTTFENFCFYLLPHRIQGEKRMQITGSLSFLLTVCGISVRLNSWSNNDAIWLFHHCAALILKYRRFLSLWIC